MPLEQLSCPLVKGLQRPKAHSLRNRYNALHQLRSECTAQLLIPVSYALVRVMHTYITIPSRRCIMARTNIILALATAIGLLGFAACEDAVDDSVPGTLSPTAREHLGQRATFELGPADSVAYMQVHINRGGGDTVDGEAPLTIAGGVATAAVAPDGTLAVSDMLVDFHDVVVLPEDFPPRGIHITDITLRLEQETTCEHTEWTDDDNSCYAELPARLMLDWALNVNGNVYELGSQHLRSMDTAVAIYKTDMAYEIDIMGQAPGTLWNWADIVEFSDFTMVVHGADSIDWGAELGP